MLRALIDQPPGTAVLLTGDGAGHARGVGFLSDLERMHKGGWAIEVLSWEHNCNRYLRRWAEDHGQFVALDNFYDYITYVKNLRYARTPCKSRRHAVPRQAATPIEMGELALA